jgi:hypothetical protein
VNQRHGFSKTKQQLISNSVDHKHVLSMLIFTILIKLTLSMPFSLGFLGSFGKAVVSNPGEIADVLGKQAASNLLVPKLLPAAIKAHAGLPGIP